MRRRSTWMRLFPALWMRWAISIAVGAAAVVALILFVSANNNNNQAPGSRTALEREYREAQVVVGADQAPHTVILRAGQSPPRAFVAAVRADMSHRVTIGNVDGPLQKIRCRPAGSRDGRVAYRCVAEAANENYPFVGVFTQATRRVTYCKRDPPPIPTENIPVSPRCTL